MADDIEVPRNKPLALRLLVGGSFPYKWQLYEYQAPAWNNPTPIGAEGRQGEGRDIGPVDLQQERRFVWVCRVISNDAFEKAVDVAGEVLHGAAVESRQQYVLTVKRPATDFELELWVKGRA